MDPGEITGVLRSTLGRMLCKVFKLDISEAFGMMETTFKFHS